jgi:hypothetical protein
MLSRFDRDRGLRDGVVVVAGVPVSLGVLPRLRIKLVARLRPD